MNVGTHPLVGTWPVQRSHGTANRAEHRPGFDRRDSVKSHGPCNGLGDMIIWKAHIGIQLMQIAKQVEKQTNTQTKTKEGERNK